MDAKALAVQLKITLHYSPAGETDQFRSLDILIFEALKSTVGELFPQRILDRTRDRMTKPEAVQVFRWAWMQLQEETIEEAWGHHADAIVVLSSKSGNREIDSSLDECDSSNLNFALDNGFVQSSLLSLAEFHQR
jgi:hypothetical protein